MILPEIIFFLGMALSVNTSWVFLFERNTVNTFKSGLFSWWYTNAESLDQHSQPSLFEKPVFWDVVPELTPAPLCYLTSALLSASGFIYMKGLRRQKNIWTLWSQTCWACFLKYFFYCFEGKNKADKFSVINVFIQKKFFLTTP